MNNKSKQIQALNKLIMGKEYLKVIVPSMEGGELLLNLKVRANMVYGLDDIPLIPKIYEKLQEEKIFKVNEFISVIKEYNNFKKPEDCMQIFNNWNHEYMKSTYSRRFIIETILLIKLLTNPKMPFIPRFKKCKDDGFFSYHDSINICKDLNQLIFRLEGSYIFQVADKSPLAIGTPRNLIILDRVMDDELFQLIGNIKSDFILFHTWNPYGEYYHKLMGLVNTRGFQVIGINARYIKKLKPTEVIITNIRR